jgi:presenilin-like A22 family membrane protease
MKHPLSVTALLLVLFLAAQIVGLSLISIDGKVTREDGHTVVEHGDTALGARPATVGFQSVLYLLLGVGIGTALVLLLIRFKVFSLWKIWFLVAVWFSTTIALGVIIPTTIALLLCLILAVWKVYWPNPVIHNLTEVFMYAGLAVLLVPLFSLLWIIVVLLIISAYDIIAVWYSKHMVTMAKAQTESKLFAGLYIPKDKAAPLTPPKAAGASKDAAKATVAASSSSASVAPSASNSAAILGGGDIAFPLLFSGVVMEWLISNNTPKIGALYETLIISLTTTIALALLFAYAKKDKFYPAMPFLSAGAFVGLGIIMLVQML